MYVVRRMVPPSWDWQCAGLAPAVDRTFAFDGAALAGGALGVESTNGVAITHVHVVRAANASRSAVEVRAVVEARPGAKWTGRIAVDSELRDAVPWVAVRVQRPGWEWPRDCVRAVIYVTVPPADERRLPANTHLHIAAGAGSLSALDPGRLALAGLSVDMRSGPVQVHGLAIAGPIAVSTASGRVNATRLSADSVSVTTANAAVALSQVAVRGTLSAVTSNASIRTADVTAARAQLRTTNGALQLHAVAAQVLSAQTSNGAVHGDAVVGEAAAVHTTNAAVALHAAPAAAARPIAVTVTSSNGPLDVTLDRVRADFDVATSHARAEVRAPLAPHHLRFRFASDAHKSGVYGNAAARSRISLATSNAHALLTFAEPRDV